MSDRHQSPDVHPTDLRVLPDDLRDHLRAAGIRLRRQVMYSGLKTEWVVLDRESDGRCEMRTSFLQFDTDSPVAAIRHYLQGFSAPAELNEAARVAMFRPWWRGTTSAPGGCADYLARTTAMAEQLLAAFRTYAPRNRSDKGVRQR